MPGLSFEVNVDGAVRKFETVAEQAKDLNKPLRVFGRYLRERAKARYQAQDFAPLADATVKHRAAAGLRKLEGKLKQDVRRSMDVARVPGGFLAKLLGRAESTVLYEAGSTSKRLSVLAEFQNRNRGTAGFAERADLKPLSVKQSRALRTRELKAMAKSVNRPILGKLVNSLVAQVNNGTLTLMSKTKGQWSEVHNKGGTAGHGATIPKRETLVIEAEDLDMLAAILKEHLLLPLASEAP